MSARTTELPAPAARAAPPEATSSAWARWRPWRLRTFDLYVARTFVGAWLVCAVSFTGLFVVIEAFAKLDRFLKQEGSIFDTLWRYHAAMVPTVFTGYAGPVLTAAAAMFAVTLLQRHNEIEAMKSTGTSVYRVLAPIFVMAALLTALTFWLQEDVLPSHREAIRTALAFSRARPLTPDPFFDAEHGLSIKVKHYSTMRRIATDVEILERHPDLNPKKLTDARQMEWIPTGGRDGSEGHWVLHQVSIQRWAENGALITNDDRTGFQRLRAVYKKLPLETSLRPIDLETSDLDISYLSWNELKTQYRRQPYHRHLAVKLHLHFAFPLAHLLLLLLALPLVLNFKNRSLLVGVAISVLLGALFYLSSSICMSIARDSVYFSPILAAWLPVMLFGALGVTLFDNMPT